MTPSVCAANRCELPMSDTALIGIREQFEQLISRVKSHLTTECDYILQDSVSFDCDPQWVEGMLLSKTTHDEDYFVFKRFGAAMGVVLDVGANWGYSVGSIRAAGSDCSIISFEVLPAFEASLSRVKELDAGRYDFVISGVGAERGVIEFFIPTVNGRAISALTSASPSSLNILVDNIVGYMTSNPMTNKYYKCQFLRMVCVVNSIDTILATHEFEVKTDPVAAIKMDVEGFEAQALKGAEKTVARDRPLLILEGGNRDADAKAFLDANGYVLTRRIGSQLQQTGGVAEGVNGIFVHPEKIDAYKGIGLMYPL